MFQHRSSFREILQFYRTKKVISQDNVKLSQWVQQSGRYEKGEAVLLAGHAVS